MGYGWKMKWSKLRHQVESMFAESVKGRVGLHSTRYRTMHDHDGRSWITIDGKEILNMALWWKWEDEFWKWMRTTRADGMAPYGQEYDQRNEACEKELARESFFWQEDLGDAMHEYLSLSIDEIVYSSNVIIRAIGMLDARFGKRRLKNLDVSNEPDLVKVLYAFRCHAENIENISCWEPHKIEPSLENYETEREKIYREFRETATEKLIHSKITRKLPNLIRSISEGTIKEKDLDTPMSNAIYRGYHEATDRKTWVNTYYTSTLSQGFCKRNTIKGSHCLNEEQHLLAETPGVSGFPTPTMPTNSFPHLPATSGQNTVCPCSWTKPGCRKTPLTRNGSNTWAPARISELRLISPFL